jgi:hypothetical protein
MLKATSTACRSPSSGGWRPPWRPPAAAKSIASPNAARGTSWSVGPSSTPSSSARSRRTVTSCSWCAPTWTAPSRRSSAGSRPATNRVIRASRGRGRFASFGFKEYANGFKLDGRRLKVHGVGRIAVRWHRALPSQPKTLRLVRQARHWYAVFVCRTRHEPLPTAGSCWALAQCRVSLVRSKLRELLSVPTLAKAAKRDGSIRHHHRSPPCQKRELPQLCARCGRETAGVSKHLASTIRVLTRRAAQNCGSLYSRADVNCGVETSKLREFLRKNRR